MSKDIGHMNIATLVSGGVDSSVALYLLKEKGYQPVAYYLKVWMEDDLSFGDCPWQEDVDYMRAVAKMLGIRSEIVSMQREYWDRVVDYTIDSVRRGLTPNPDMMCNKLIKFGAFYEKYGRDFDRIATGHYASTVRDNSGRIHLTLSSDRKKDQTYFLSQMSYDQVARSMFPLGDVQKGKVREIARRLNFPNALRKDSQGICFLGKINFRDFVKKYVGTRKGKIVDNETGKILGEHQGFWFYTIGQRSGLGLGGGPWYVVNKDTDSNTIFISNAVHPDALYHDEIRLAAFNWINCPDDSAFENDVKIPGISRMDIQFKIRHTPELSDGRIELTNDNVIIRPREKVAGVARGQFGVIYHNDECLGGGVIC